jgi:hypothetical protein
MDAATREAIRERLQQIADVNGGLLTPEAVVSDARKKTSPLHGQFTWNQKDAAYQYWIAQARTLMARVKVEITHKETIFKAPYWLHDAELEDGEQGYRSTIEIRSDKDKAVAVVFQEISRAAGAIRRAQAVAASLGLSDMMLGLLNSIELAQEKVRKAA